MKPSIAFEGRLWHVFAWAMGPPRPLGGFLRARPNRQIRARHGLNRGQRHQTLSHWGLHRTRSSVLLEPRAQEDSKIPGSPSETVTSQAAKSDRTTHGALGEIACGGVELESKTQERHPSPVQTPSGSCLACWPPVSNEAKPPLPQKGLAGNLPRRMGASQTLSGGGGQHLR
ncbi:uncharacterized protein BO95DRAFT_499102 [Aspergillus brunneoviolaceus CBS 621.78]|uniref:Uncharacterized protein n=1 Tax=Aspergillus brunneoviolaceus CBS 621.78 TaxID=1450534 RepID=A0ACD1G5Z7_9EURO|nr:hypothetical protein BO95DRAFT_499102 [Aspergillus brunneoviolaceus CBS 621.78]RAH44551.1 hypothetical protein BO95DRAFT_499102 [Aspergillus brunneoviolaceus CBS 621.78]